MARKTTNPAERCHNTHKELSLGGGTILGASCNYPRPGYDVYLGFDGGMRIESLAPWRNESTSTVYAKLEIPDGGVPKDKAEFDAMILWLAGQLQQGKRVHIGCIGGHGRTGLVLAVLKCVIDDDQNAAEWVRKAHCSKAIETQRQVDWLQQHYGIVPVAPRHAGWSTGSLNYGSGTASAGKGMSSYSSASSRPLGDGMVVQPMPMALTLFR